MADVNRRGTHFSSGKVCSIYTHSSIYVKWLLLYNVKSQAHRFDYMIALAPFSLSHPLSQQANAEVHLSLAERQEALCPVIHDQSQICVYGHGHQHTALQHPLPAHKNHHKYNASSEKTVVTQCKT